MKIYHILAGTLLLACSSPKDKVIENISHDNFDWLEGEWIAENDSSNFHEIWERNGEKVRNGVGVVMSGSDTVSIENLQILPKEDGLYYSVKISNQNEGKTVFFKLNDASDSIFVFKNPRHDFPKRITYRRINSSSMEVVIDEGHATGHSEIFKFNKVK